MKRRIAFAIAALSLLLQAANAQERIIDDIRISRVGEITTIEIQIACAMRFQSDFALQSASLIEVRLAPFDDCRLLAAGGSEIRRPLNGRLAGLLEVEYEPIGATDGIMLLRFSQGVSYVVNQAADLRTIVVTLDSSLPPGPQVSRQEPQDVPAGDVAQPMDAGPASTLRQPLSRRVIEPEESADFVINLQSTREPVDPATTAAIPNAGASQLYVSRTQANGETWFRLRLGFFGSEREARETLEGLKSRFPRAWIGRAEPEEIASARDLALHGDGQSALPLVAAESIEARSQAAVDLLEKPDNEIYAQMAAAREAMLDGEYATAISIYSDLQRTAGDHRADTAEFLGLAYERAGRTDLARTQYEWYLQEFPANVNIARVRQRLNGIVLAASQPAVVLRDAEPESRWDSGFGISQYYRRDENQFDADQESTTTLSALITDIDYSMRRRGERLDMSGRVLLSQFHDMLDEAGPGDQERISYAFFELESNVNDWWLRLGRQTLHNFGVLGRFDGARFDYAWAPEKIVHLMTGHPVESTRDSIETGQQFYGAAVEFQNLVGNWDFSAFVNQQAIESLTARRAVGTEIRYADSRRTLSAIVDYDIDYKELNTILMLGTWRLGNGITLSALIDERTSPILTTRNALIGQPVATLEELLLVWNEDEIRQLAVDRTADSSSLTLGIAAPLGQRFQINFDYTSNELTGTVESGGVAAIEATGTQEFYSTSIVGSGVFGTNDVSIVNLRYGRSGQFESTTLTYDIRIPVGRRVRLNPRIRLSSWRGLLDGRQRDSISPAVRLFVNTRRHYRIELEIGANMETRLSGLLEREASGTFFNLGYRASFQ